MSPPPAAFRETLPDPASGKTALASPDLDDTLAQAAPVPIRMARGSAAPPTHSPGQVVSRYRLESLLGRGGMGEVWAAYDTELDRRVALKFILPKAWAQLGDDVRDMFRREAQAMARLSDPHVVSIYDIADRGEFVTLELVGGGTLSQWLEQEARTPADILAVFAQAGRGLAAAHAAGLIHRDFKPDNVLLREDGSACVGDFGLALLTEHGGNSSVAGTPLFMAPEQHLGETIDARSDQYSFCVSLWMALFGEHPFYRGDGKRLRSAVLDGERAKAPRRRGVPTRVRRALERGLARDPAARFPSMDALVHTLRPRPLGRMLLVGLTGAAMISTLAMAAAPSGPEPCERVADGDRALWTKARRSTLFDALAGAQVPGARAAAERTREILDDYSSGLVRMREQSCRDAKVEESMSAELYDRSMMCLDARRHAAQALIEMLLQPDPRRVSRAVNAALGLPPMSECADSEALLTTVPLPATPAARERYQTALGILVEANVQQHLGLIDAGLERLDDIDSATAEEFPQVGARAACSRGTYLELKTEYPAARAAWAECASLAGRARDQDALFKAWLGDMGTQGYHQGQFEEALAKAPMLEAVIESAGNPADMRAIYFQTRGLLLARAGKAGEALKASQRSLEAYRELGDARGLSGALTNLCADYYDLGEYQKAFDHCQEAVTIRRSAFGASHPWVLTAEANMAALHEKVGTLDDSIRASRAVLVRIERDLGANHPLAAMVKLNLAQALSRSRGDRGEALQLGQEGLQTRLDVFGREHLETALAHDVVGSAHRDQGDIGKAREHLEAALAIREKLLPADHPSLRSSYQALSVLEADAGRKGVARAYEAKAAKIASRDPQR